MRLVVFVSAALKENSLPFLVAGSTGMTACSNLPRPSISFWRS
jgi:hypothetical protein